MPTTEEIARITHDAILDEPEKHDQDHWATVDLSTVDPQAAPVYKKPDGVNYVGVCASTACAAGWTVVAAGDTLVMPRGHLSGVGKTHLFYCRTRNGRYNSIQERAQKLLKIDGWEAGWLFSGVRTRRQILHAYLLLSRGDRDGFQRYITQQGG